MKLATIPQFDYNCLEVMHTLDTRVSESTVGETWLPVGIEGGNTVNTNSQCVRYNEAQYGTHVIPNAANYILDQTKTPIIDALSAYRDTVRFHMPGHRGGKSADPDVLSVIGQQAFSHDVTGVPGMDDLHEPTGCIKEAQDLAASLFGADKTYFVVNGTSGAIQTMTLAVINDGDSIIIPRNIHKSVLSALILSGAKPVFLLPSYDPYLGFALGVEENSLSETLTKDPDAQKAKAVFMVNPTYYGTSQDLTSVSELIHSLGKTLLVDEAHGPHFRFHPELPKPALESGADAVSQGAHKMIGALTQASFLHIKEGRIDPARLKASFQYLASTSPSYLLMASLDSARKQMALYGTQLLDHALGLADDLRREVNNIPGLYCFGKEITKNAAVEEFDPTKVTITVRELGITGYQAEKYLRHEKGIQVEMSDLYNVLVIVSYANTSEDVSLLVRALRDLVQAVANGSLPKNLLACQKSIPSLPGIPKMALVPRAAVQRPWERALLDSSVGRISAEVVTCYPPGIPILYPGEVISQETVEYLHVIRHLAFGISGPEDRTLTTLRVVKDS